MENEHINIPIPLEQAIKASRYSTVAFGRIFLPKMFEQESPEFHKTISKYLDMEGLNLILEVFRYGAKTTLTRAYIIKSIIYGDFNLSYVISSADRLAKSTLRVIRRHFDPDSPLYLKELIEYYKIKPVVPWNETTLTFQHGYLNKQISINSIGVGGELRGASEMTRPDLLVLDDILPSDAIYNALLIEKANQFVTSVVLPGVMTKIQNPNSRIICLQTPMHDRDIIRYLADDPKFALLSFPKYIGNKSSWEAMFPASKQEEEVAVAKKRGLSTYNNWLMEHQLVRVSDSVKSFSKELLHLLNLEDTLLDFEGTLFISIDPTPANSNPDKVFKLDDYAICLMGIDENKCYLFKEFTFKSPTDEEIIGCLHSLYLAYENIMFISVEAVGFQSNLISTYQKGLSQRKMFPTIVGVKDKRSKFDRIQNEISSYLNQGKLYVDLSCIKAQDQFRLFSPFSFSSMKKDVLDALALGILTYRTKRPAKSRLVGQDIKNEGLVIGYKL